MIKSVRDGGTTIRLQLLNKRVDCLSSFYLFLLNPYQTLRAKTKVCGSGKWGAGGRGGGFRASMFQNYKLGLCTCGSLEIGQYIKL